MEVPIPAVRVEGLPWSSRWHASVGAVFGLWHGTTAVSCVPC